MRFRLVSLIALAALSQPALSQTKLSIFKSGNDLHSACGTDLNAPTGLIEHGNCMGYIQGTMDAYMTFRAETNQPSCFAAGVTGVQVRDLVVAQLRENPQERHNTAARLVVKAISPLIVPCA
ncbi:hypothetical protein GRI40_08950 [Altererythrobacter aerius]|uniref:Rap1a immunity protein domain-containing protein n=1 Tax=Tsuneonella aeria TaxID=1837929 RepID=A0A6I4TCR4_9SPHN|nr:Rap1a/Tai family immunity protein [Tsuneonella aeria]MXO75339.1 hypothetical protein [Tsuneonella aeria]